jgi:hypothetical protein
MYLYICCDIVPSITPASIDKDIGYYIFTDASTGYIHAIPLRDKSSESFLQALSYVLRFYTRFNLTVKILRSDRESDLISNEVDQYLSNHKIVTQTSPSYGHYQNRAERAI